VHDEHSHQYRGLGRHPAVVWCGRCGRFPCIRISKLASQHLFSKGLRFARSPIGFLPRLQWRRTVGRLLSRCGPLPIRHGARRSTAWKTSVKATS
jgi:hypothetical protein